MTTPVVHYLHSYALMLAIATLMMLFYDIVLRRRIDFIIGRMYLLCIPVLCLLVPGIRYCLGLLMITTENTVLHLSRSEAETYMYIHPDAMIMAHENEEGAATFVEHGDASITTLWWLVPLCLLSVSLMLIVIQIFQMARMQWYIRQSKAEAATPEYRIIRSAQVKTPFSYARTMFLPNDMPENKERIVISHEAAHIRCRHYRDVWIVELLTRLMWFNPILWIVRNRLRNIHEFQADRMVLDGGTDILTYQTLLLEEVMEDSNIMANGFNHSFIRRRFQEMKRKQQISTSTKVKTMTTLWILTICGIASVYGVTAGSSIIIHLVEEDMPISSNEHKSIKESLLYAPKGNGIEVNNKEGHPTHAEDGWPILYGLPEYNGTVEPGRYICRHTTETHVTYIVACTSDNAFYKFGGPDAYIVDTETGIHYAARQCIPKNTWNYFHLKGMKGKTFMITVVFPPLPNSVREIEFYQTRYHLQTGEKHTLHTLDTNRR